MDNKLRKNGEGYSDPTAYLGLRSTVKEDNRIQREVYLLVRILRYIAEKSGFVIIGRLELREKKTGRIFK